MYDKGPRRSAPVNVGDEFDVTIENEGSKGDGMAKVKGFVLFVPGAKKGENVHVRVTKVLRSVGFAEVVGQGSGDNTDSTESSESSEAA